ncbi:MAG: immunity 22 family protein [Bacteroidota bacterium]
MMSWVYVFVAKNKFASFEEMRAFIDPGFTEDGDYIPSDLMKETQLFDIEPGFIEAVYEESPKVIRILLSESSYAEQWLSQIKEEQHFNNAICIYAPNHLDHPEGCSMKYLGKFAILTL